MICSTMLINHSAFSAIKKSQNKKVLIQDALLIDFAKTYSKKSDLKKLKSKTLQKAGKAVPALVKVMKSGDFPVHNRWLATFLLGQIAGKKASAFISKFAKHPNWIMRVASLKTLLALKDRKYGSTFAASLKDGSMIVRTQALENIKYLKMEKYGSDVWAMMFHKKNYQKTRQGLKRSNIFKNILHVVGDLNYKKAQKPIFKMIQKQKYNDIFASLDYALSKLTKVKSPNGSVAIKRTFWKKQKI